MSTIIGEFFNFTYHSFCKRSSLVRRWIKDQIADGEKCTHLHPEQQKPEESEGGTSTLIPPGDTDPATSPDSSSAEQSAKGQNYLLKSFGGFWVYLCRL